LIRLSILAVLSDSISFRGVAKNTHRWLGFLRSDENIPTPSHSTLGRWIRRVGLYQLTKPLEKINDMIAIVDTSITIGKGKCVVILGLSSCYYTEILKEKRALTFKDVQILDLSIVESVSGEIIEGALHRSEARGGTIVQICGDGGGENVRGIKLFAECVVSEKINVPPFTAENNLLLLSTQSEQQEQKGSQSSVTLIASDLPPVDSSSLMPPKVFFPIPEDIALKSLAQLKLQSKK
jgi:hypothetical protein